MGTSTIFSELSLVLPRDNVVETPMQRAYEAAQALYEATFDDAAPGVAGGQTYQGHDHTPQGGGGPINRGSLWSMCGLTALLQLSFSAKNQAIEMVAPSSPIDTAMIHPSPGIRTTAPLTGWICYWAQKSDVFYLEYGPDGIGGRIELPVPGGEKLNWQQFSIVADRPGSWHARNLFIRCGSYDSSDVPVFALYSFQLDETDVLINSGAPEVERPARSGDTIRVAMPVLEETLVAKDEFLDSFALRELYGYTNALYEGIEEKRAPGASAQTCRGHDHDSNNYGGRALARGGCYTASVADTVVLYSIAYNGFTMSGYYAWDNDDGADRRSAASVGMAIFWVGPGIDNNNSPPVSTPYLTAYLYVRWDAGSGVTPTFTFRAKHIATGNYSAVTTVSTTQKYDGWLVIDKIPCAEDAVNELQWEVAMSGAGFTSVDIDLVAHVTYEVPGVGARIAESLPALAAGVD